MAYNVQLLAMLAYKNISSVFLVFEVKIVIKKLLFTWGKSHQMIVYF